MKFEIVFCLAVLPLAALSVPLSSISVEEVGSIDAKDFVMACTDSTCYHLSDGRKSAGLEKRKLHSVSPMAFPENTEDVVFYKCGILCEDITERVVTIGDKKMVLPKPNRRRYRRDNQPQPQQAISKEGVPVPDEEQRSLQTIYDNTIKPLSHAVHTVIDPFLPPSLREKPAKIPSTTAAPGATSASTPTTTTTTTTPAPTT